MEFTEARHIARMRRNEVMDYFQISKTTLTRYEQTGKAPIAIIECLLMIGGHMPTFKHAQRRDNFSGWSFSDGYLYSDAGQKFTSGDLLAINIDRQLIRCLELENKRLKKLVVQSETSNIIPFPTTHRDQKILA